MKHYFLILLVGILGVAELKAQDVAAVDSVNRAPLEELNILDFLPPLSVLIDSAIANSAQVDLLDYTVKSREYQIGTLRKDWGDLLYVGAQYRYTDYDRLIFDDIGTPQPQTALGYQLSAGVRLPFSYFVGRKDRIRSAEMDVLSAKAQQQNAEEIVTELVVETYHRLLLLQKLIVITTDAKESSDLILEMAEDRFREGEISLDELGNSTSMKAQFSAEHESLKMEFSTTFSRLERLVGVPLAKLQNL